MKNINSKTIAYLLFTVIAVSLLVSWYPLLFPSAHLSFKLNRDQIEQLAEQSLAEWGYSPGENEIVTELRVRKGLLRYISKYFTDYDSVEYYMSHNLPAYYWSIMWTANDNASVDSNAILNTGFPGWVKRVGLNLNQSGEEISFWIEAYEDSILASTSQETAKSIADSLILVKYGSHTEFLRIKQQTRDTRTDYSVIYSIGEIAKLPVNIEIDLIGDQVGRYEYVYENIADDGSFMNRMFSVLLLFLAISGAFIYIFIKKLRDDELSLKSALPLGILMFVSVLSEFLLQPQTIDTGRMVGGLILGPLFSGFICVIVVSCADAITRDAWNGKMFSFDLAANRKLFNPFTGSSVLRGIALGIIFAGFSILLFKITRSFTFIDFVPYSSDIRDLNSHSPFLFRISKIITETLWIQFVFVLFLSSFFARFLAKKRWIVLIVAIFWALRSNPNDIVASPTWFIALFYYISGLYFVIIFMKYDFLTSLTTFFVYLLTFEALRMFHFEHMAFVLSGSVFLLILFIMATSSLIGIRNDLSKDDLVQYTPKHVKRILDRERLKRELEIAKRVQLNFLPRSHPHIKNLEIASICYPAEEVGGDYYDFIEYNDNKLGIVIGDVSGKGISAAFYMTLTKGFIRSLTRTLYSPKKVLTEINSLFYENVERSHFISMIYGVFDLDKYTFSFARAGHNPLIFKSNYETRTICPPGLALGLDKGPVFEKIIAEETITLSKGDVLVLYTDGFSEAMDKDHHEFSESMLEEIVQTNHDATAKELLDFINVKVKAFTKSTPQHDDMTMLVFKLT